MTTRNYPVQQYDIIILGCARSFHKLVSYERGVSPKNFLNIRGWAPKVPGEILKVLGGAQLSFLGVLCSPREGGKFL